eukprot:TRINITY_DN10780_c0_g2_i2.p3 TRINITY_DN10780_c0_g2~~TRINITY_DN10780_c0_g2_i2.p3  ORF type:complete len:117 (+),score=18.37 TRINITY_DN10780_c0_g2_i2:37-387(+)
MQLLRWATYLLLCISGMRAADLLVDDHDNLIMVMNGSMFANNQTHGQEIVTNNRLEQMIASFEARLLAQDDRIKELEQRLLADCSDCPANQELVAPCNDTTGISAWSLCKPRVQAE